MPIVPLKRKNTRKPSNASFDFSHPIVSKADALLALNGRGGGVPYDDAEKAVWTADTSFGTTPYKYQYIDGGKQFARQDLDTAGIHYTSGLVGVNTDSNPFLIVCSYTVLLAPTADRQAIYDISDVTHNGTPVALLASQDSSNLRYFTGGGYQFTNIPVQVGKKHLLIHRYDGVNTHDFYDSAKGVWEVFTGASTNSNSGDVFRMGTGFNLELPSAFEFVLASYGKQFSLAECKDLAKNPYQLFKSRPVYLPISTATGAVFQPAWANNVNNLIGNGINGL